MHSDEIDAFVGTLVFVSVSFLFDLFHGIIAGLFDFEFDDVDIFPVFEGEVDASPVGEVFGDEFDSRECHEGIEDAAVESFVLADVVVRIIAIRDAGENGFDDIDVGIDIPGGKRSMERFEFVDPETIIGELEVVLDEGIIEGASDFLIGDPESVEGFSLKGLHLLDGEVSGLEEEGLEVDLIDIKTIEDLASYFQILQIREVEFFESPVDEFDEKSGSRRSEPVVSVFPFGEEVEKSKGVIKRFIKFSKAVSVVVHSHGIDIHSFQVSFRSEIVDDLGKGVSAYAIVAFVQGDIFQVIESRKH